MGTNFYAYETPIRRDRNVSNHIGKRSAAGLFCWDCKEALCEGGNRSVHTGSNRLDSCPSCGARPTKVEGLDNSTAGRELGFNNSRPQAKTGIASACSFSWAMHPADLFTMDPNTTLIMDEYRRSYTPEQFIDVLRECPIQFYTSIGRDFS